jgi:hypothetical protein
MPISVARSDLTRWFPSKGRKLGCGGGGRGWCLEDIPEKYGPDRVADGGYDQVVQLVRH